jgi:hypothetical protein
MPAREYCRNCGIAHDVGGGCGICKPKKPIRRRAARNTPATIPVTNQPMEQLAADYAAQWRKQCP